MPPEQSEKKSFLKEVQELIRVLIISLIIVVPIRLFVAQPFIVRGASMEPTYHDGEYLIVDELSYRLSAPERGQVIVFHYPRDPQQFFIKRIVGLPGETLIIKNNTISVESPGSSDPKTLDESYLGSGAVTAPNETIKLNPDEYFVMGDNRLNSYDSRGWGPLDKRFLIGRVIVRLWPLSRIGIGSN